MRLILASSSKTRKMLLHRICGNSFEILPPEIDETPLSLEDPKNLSERLSLEKALKISELNRDAVVIGSDQVAFCDGKILKKVITWKMHSNKFPGKLENKQHFSLVWHWQDMEGKRCKVAQ